VENRALLSVNTDLRCTPPTEGFFEGGYGLFDGRIGLFWCSFGALLVCVEICVVLLRQTLGSVL